MCKSLGDAPRNNDNDMSICIYRDECYRLSGSSTIYNPLTTWPWVIKYTHIDNYTQAPGGLDYDMYKGPVWPHVPQNPTCTKW